VSYVQSVIMPGETLVAEAHTHRWIYAPSIIFLLISIGLAIYLWPVGLALLVLTFFVWLRAFIYSVSTELAVTNKRVIAKFGFIRRSTIELSLSKVESFHVEQSILGRILDFGTIIIKGSGGTNTPIPSIAAPLKFRSAALTAIDTPTASARFDPPRS
jgi:uncharacterized membrane protein YdbT with pleckstrin-like domain